MAPMTPPKVLLHDQDRGISGLWCFPSVSPFPPSTRTAAAHTAGETFVPAGRDTRRHRSRRVSGDRLREWLERPAEVATAIERFVASFGTYAGHYCG